EDAGVTLPSPEYGVVLRRAGAPVPPAEIGPEAPPAAGEEGAPPRAPDVSVDTSLDEQIEEDRQTSEEEDLLSPPE
nr:hypothetical protein [Gemmatimonadota bacterium]NIR80602.1 hypothetical protein [Gemmatimonadota bacterium]NIT89374.1 hypothetical protein [Gemmatimonadota bacterium]NIU33185.1 hypothetical protein [Gemmatimonadota bacterium]NIU37524.1 hypothetical protein [Gemmatimonadota bacterium]